MGESFGKSVSLPDQMYQTFKYWAATPAWGTVQDLALGF
jgi:hypothetical protein